MDKRLMYAKISKWIYKATYSTGLVRSNFIKLFEKQARKNMRKLLPPDDALVCLPKTGVIEINKKVKNKEMVVPTKVIDYFIDKANYHVIMNYCICRDSNKCKDYPHEYGCLFMGEAAKGIHPDLCRPVTKKEAKDYIKKCDEAGLIHLVGKAYFDALWLDIPNHEQLFTVCNCCPCCCISLATQYMPPDFTDWFYRMPGVSTSVSDDCIGCGKCLEKCIYNGIKLEGDRAVITEQCRACGRCVEACKQKAIKVNIDDKDYIQKTIEFLEHRVDLS